jgi:small subunit ribosomal protein S20
LTSKSALKAARVSSRRRERNKAVRSQVKTSISKAEKIIFSGELKDAQEAVKAAVSTLDKAAGKQIIHGRNASRRKARLLKKLNQAATRSAAAETPEPKA